MKHYFLKPALIGLLVFSMFSLSQLCAQETSLTWKLATNDRFSLVMQQQAQIASQVDQRSRTSSNDMQMWIDWEVVDVGPNGTSTIKQTIKRITLVTKTPNESGEQVTNVDTGAQDKASGLAARLSQMIAPLIGGTITIQMTERGAIESVVIPESTMESLRQAPESMRLRQLFTKKGLSEMFGQAAWKRPTSRSPKGIPGSPAVRSPVKWVPLIKSGIHIPGTTGRFQHADHYAQNRTARKIAFPNGCKTG